MKFGINFKAGRNEYKFYEENRLKSKFKDQGLGPHYGNVELLGDCEDMN
jgi:hypothetical protein